jgi:nicotinate-nucleotide adenylyltransferase
VRIGIFGGTFDPPHVGHLLVATDAADILGLDRVLWIPAAQQPLKADSPPVAAREHRSEMVRLTVQRDPRFALDESELSRPGLSYTVATVEALASRSAGAELILLLGEDAWSLFPRWREPGRILELARVVVFRRGDVSAQSIAEKGVEWITTRRIDVSSTEVRARAGRGAPIRGFVVDSVADYIGANRLYE